MKGSNNIRNLTNSDVIDENQLLAYLEGNLSSEEQFRIESILDADPFLNDAIDGLAEIKDKETIKQITAQINLQLKRNIKSRKEKRRSRRKLTEHSGWLYTLIVLLLAVLAWAVIHVLLKYT